MSKFIYWHRHGQTTHNAQRAPYGDKQYTSTLTTLGRAQAVRLGQELVKHGPFDLYLTSPLPRAVQTATIVQGFNDVFFEGDQALIEPIGESQEVTWQRVKNLAQRLMAAPQQRILLSTHGFVSDALSVYFQGRDVKSIASLSLTPNCGFGWAEIGPDGKVREMQHAYARHLDSLTATVSDKPAESRAAAYGV